MLALVNHQGNVDERPGRAGCEEGDKRKLLHQKACINAKEDALQRCRPLKILALVQGPGWMLQMGGQFFRRLECTR